MKSLGIWILLAVLLCSCSSNVNTSASVNSNTKTWPIDRYFEQRMVGWSPQKAINTSIRSILDSVNNDNYSQITEYLQKNKRFSQVSLAYNYLLLLSQKENKDSELIKLIEKLVSDIENTKSKYQSKRLLVMSLADAQAYLHYKGYKNSTEAVEIITTGGKLDNTADKAFFEKYTNPLKLQLGIFSYTNFIGNPDGKSYYFTLSDFYGYYLANIDNNTPVKDIYNHCVNLKITECLVGFGDYRQYNTEQIDIALKLYIESFYGGSQIGTARLSNILLYNNEFRDKRELALDYLLGIDDKGYLFIYTLIAYYLSNFDENPENLSKAEKLLLTGTNHGYKYADYWLAELYMNHQSHFSHALPNILHHLEEAIDVVKNARFHYSRLHWENKIEGTNKNNACMHYSKLSKKQRKLIGADYINYCNNI